MFIHVFQNTQNGNNIECVNNYISELKCKYILAGDFNSFKIKKETSGIEILTENKEITCCTETIYSAKGEVTKDTFGCMYWDLMRPMNYEVLKEDFDNFEQSKFKNNEERFAAFEKLAIKVKNICDIWPLGGTLDHIFSNLEFDKVTIAVDIPTNRDEFIKLISDYTKINIPSDHFPLFTTFTCLATLQNLRF